jgi:hypothetical protein
VGLKGQDHALGIGRGEGEDRGEGFLKPVLKTLQTYKNFLPVNAQVVTL